MHTFQTRYNGNIAPVVLYDGIVPAELLQVISSHFRIKGQIVGFRDQKGFLLVPNHICRQPESVKGEGVYDVVVKESSTNSDRLWSNRNGANENPPSQHQSRVQRAQISSVTSSFHGGGMSLSSSSKPAGRSHHGPEQNVYEERPSRREERKGTHRPTAESQNYMVPILRELNLQTEIKNEAIKLAENKDPGIKESFLDYLRNRDRQTFIDRIKERVYSLKTRSATMERQKAYDEERNKTRREEAIGNPDDRSRFNKSMQVQYRPETSKPFAYKLPGSSNTLRNHRPQQQSSSFSDFTGLPWAYGNGPAADDRPITRGGAPRFSDNNLGLGPLSGLGVQSGHPTSRRYTSMQEKFIQIIHELEKKALLDEQTVSLIFTLILEENHEMYSVLNSFLSNNIDHMELSLRLQRMVERLSTYIERPTSPIPRGKHSLLQFLTVLTQNTLSDRGDQTLLNKLVQDENDYVLSALDVFESDRDTQNLIDSLKIIIKKYKSMGLGQNSLMASSFYNANQQRQLITSQRRAPNIFQSSEGGESEDIEFIPETIGQRMMRGGSQGVGARRTNLAEQQNKYYRPQTAHQMRKFTNSRSNLNMFYQPARDQSTNNVSRVQANARSESESEQGGTYNRFHITQPLNGTALESQKVFSDVPRRIESERNLEEIKIHDESQLVSNHLYYPRDKSIRLATEDDDSVRDVRNHIEALMQDHSDHDAHDERINRTTLQKLKEVMVPYEYGVLQDLIRNGEPRVQQCMGLTNVFKDMRQLGEILGKICKDQLKQVVVDKFGVEDGDEIMEKLERDDALYQQPAHNLSRTGLVSEFLGAVQSILNGKESVTVEEERKRKKSKDKSEEFQDPEDIIKKIKGMVESMNMLNEFQTQAFKRKIQNKDQELRSVLLKFHYNYDMSKLKDGLLLSLGLFTGPRPKKSEPKSVKQAKPAPKPSRTHANQIFQSPESSELQQFQLLIDNLIAEGEVEAQFRQELIQEFKDKNEVLLAAVELFEAIDDKDDLVNSLSTVLDKIKQQRGRRPRLIGLQPTQRNLNMIQMAPAPVRHQEESKQRVPMKLSDLDDTPKSIQDDEKKRFKQHQHQIVAKLAKDGYFEFSQAIKIHEVWFRVETQLVDQDNKNIIFAFEVFAVNKNKEDFAETLDLIRQVVYNMRSPQHPSSSEDSDNFRRSPQSSAQRDFGSLDANDQEEETIQTILAKLSEQFDLTNEQVSMELRSAEQNSDSLCKQERYVNGSTSSVSSRARLGIIKRHDQRADRAQLTENLPLKARCLSIILNSSMSEDHNSVEPLQQILCMISEKICENDQQRTKLRVLHVEENKILKAALEVYLDNKDIDQLRDTIKILMGLN